MRVIGKRATSEFGRSHSDVALQISVWLAEVEEAEWRTSNDVKARYASASFLNDNRVVFNIKGNRYRIDTKIDYQHQIVLVKRMGTHSEYERWSFERG
jgi:mRNA interferase HigB